MSEPSGRNWQADSGSVGGGSGGNSGSGGRAANHGARPEPARRGGPAGVRGKHQRRAVFLNWLKKIHGWIGLWGAVLGLLFGTTGFFLNHRGGPLKVSTGAPQVSTMQVPVPSPAPATPREMAAWLQQSLQVPGKLGRVLAEKPHPVAWGDKTVIQPGHWQIMFIAPNHATQAEYWVGSGMVSVKRTDNSLLATLTNLHKGEGMSVAWVLLVDTMAGGLILLSLSGVVLWTGLHRRRTVGAVIVGCCLVALVVCGLA